MNLIKWNELYKNNKRLDEIFIDKYKSDKQLFQKNCLELLIEIGEFVNETKVFKYWSTKSPDKEKMLDEYADVITMILTFYGIKNLELKELNKTYNKDILELIHDLYELSLRLNIFLDEEVLEEIFNLVLYIGKILEFKENEIIDSIENKQKIIEKRLNSDY